MSLHLADDSIIIWKISSLPFTFFVSHLPNERKKQHSTRFLSHKMSPRTLAFSHVATEFKVADSVCAHDETFFSWSQVMTRLIDCLHYISQESEPCLFVLDGNFVIHPAISKNFSCKWMRCWIVDACDDPWDLNSFSSLSSSHLTFKFCAQFFNDEILIPKSSDRCWCWLDFKTYINQAKKKDKGNTQHSLTLLLL